MSAHPRKDIGRLVPHHGSGGVSVPVDRFAASWERMVWFACSFEWRAGQVRRRDSGQSYLANGSAFAALAKDYEHGPATVRSKNEADNA